MEPKARIEPTRERLPVALVGAERAQFRWPCIRVVRNLTTLRNASGI
jgi:hypothetical protein